MAKTYKSDTQTREDRHKLILARKNVAFNVDKEARKRWIEINKILDFKRDRVVGSDTQSIKIKYPLLWTAYENYIATLTAAHPQTVIQADGREDLIKQIYWKGVLDYVKRKIYADDSYDEFIQSFVVAGKAVLKVVRDIDVSEVEETIKSGENSYTVMKRKEDVVKTNQTVVECIDPRRVWLSPETRYKGPVLGDECPYIIEEMIKDPDYIEQKYNVELEDSELESISIYDEVTEEGSRVVHSTIDKKDDIKRVRVFAYYGVWNIGKKTLKNAEVLFTTKRILQERNFDEVYHHGKKPYIVSFNFKKFFKPEARGALDSVVDLDLEYNEHMNRIRTYLRRMVNPKWAKTKGTSVDEDALLHPDVGVVVEESQPNSVRPLVPPPIGSEIFSKASSVEALFQLVTGLVFGASSIKEVGTATGQSIVEKGADVKFGRMSKLLERAIEERDIMILQLEQQFAPEEGTDIRITGSDIVQMIKDKKRLHQEATRLWQEEIISLLQQGVSEEEAIMQHPSPVDDFAQFELSEDGRSVITSYTRGDIQGQFELRVLSQSSNKLNRAVKSQQYLQAIDKSTNDITIDRAELWRRFFNINGEDEIDDLVKPIQHTPQIPQQQNGDIPGQQVTNPNENAIQSAVNGAANRVV